MDKDNNLEDIEELDFNYNDGSKISLYENPIRAGRKDKSTFITEGDLSMRSSNIMLGNDNKNLQDGVYVNEDEIKNALSKYLNESSENKVIKSKKTGRKVSVDEILEKTFKCLKNSSVIKLGEKNSKIKNQDSRTVYIKGTGIKNFKRAGILMLGNKGFKLPCGEYILEEELQNALKEYVFSNEKKDEKPKSSEEFFKHLEGEEITLKPSDVKVLDIDEKNIKNQNNEDILNKLLNMNADSSIEIKHNEEKKDDIPNLDNLVSKKHKVKIKNKKFLGTALLLASTVAFLSTLGVTGGNIKQKKIVTKSIEYTVQNYEEKEIKETYKELSDRIAGSLVIGNDSYFPEGVDYHESSDYDFGGRNNNDTIGNKLREEDNYNVDYFSILKDGKIVYVESNNGKNLNETINKVSKALNCNEEELQARIHFGGEKVTGWTDFDDYKDKTGIKRKSHTENVYLGTTIEIMEDNGKNAVIINDNENKIEVPFENVGDKIDGKNNKSYVVTDIQNKESITKENEVSNVDIGFGKDSVSIPLTMAGALAGASLSLAHEEEKKKKLDEVKKKSKFAQFKEKLSKKIRGKSL